jgi:Dolichyl-phosphate-mannose-protein mannosyltransferase
VNKRPPDTSTLDSLAFIKAMVLFLGTSLLYFATRTPALDEHDAVQFAMGVLDFNLWEHQPHPPGYPVFIALGWIGNRVLGVGPDVSLHFISALGGGLFVAAWFLIIRLQFNERLAWWIASCLTITPAVWMTATKVLTDSLSAGLLSIEILASLYFLTQQSPTALWTASLFGAAAAGVRPQLILVVIVVLATALRRRRCPMKIWIVAFALLIAGCLLWLLPMSYTQWRLRPDIPFWQVYPHLAYDQWRWRLDKPGTYIGAGDWSLRYLGTRVVTHFLGWFGLGFGLLQSFFCLAIGGLLVVAGLISYLLRVRTLNDNQFWKVHAPWVLVHIAVIFISLSAAERYYLVIFPLLWVALLRGVLQLRSPWNLAALALPALVLYIVVPLAIDNHCRESPSVRLAAYLARLYPPDRRNNVALLFQNVRRHAQWYAPGFVTFREIPPAHDLSQIVGGAAAVYTDDARVALPPGWSRIPLVGFRRSQIIYLKHHALTLYLIDRHQP